MLKTATNLLNPQFTTILKTTTIFLAANISMLFLVSTTHIGVALGGVYDPEIRAMKQYFGAYIEQNNKNIAAMAKLISSYQRVGNAMSNIIEAKKYIRGKCNTEKKEALQSCLASQQRAILLLEFYTRDYESIMTQAKAEVSEAQKIINQDMSAHLARFEKIEKDFWTWKNKVLPTLKEQFNKGKEVLVSRYSTELVQEFHDRVFAKSDIVQAALLGQEVAHLTGELYTRAMRFLSEHRLSHAKFTLESMRWFLNQQKNMWKAVSETAKNNEKIKKIQGTTYQTTEKFIGELEKEIAKKDASHELTAAKELLQKRTAEASLSPDDREAMKLLFSDIEKIHKSTHEQKHAIEETLIERGFTWLGY